VSAKLGRLQSRDAVQQALDEFVRVGRTRFLEKYGFGKAREYFVRDAASGQLCDSKAIAGAAYGYQYPQEGPLTADEFSGGELRVVAKLQSLHFVVEQGGGAWSDAEIDATVAAYFEMLRAESAQTRYVKTEHNAALRARLHGRTKGAVELKHMKISAVLRGMDLPFIGGYQPMGNVQLLLRKAVARHVLENADQVRAIVDAFEEVQPAEQREYRAVLVEPPPLEDVIVIPGERHVRLRRKIDHAARDEANRSLGRMGEQWAVEFEQRSLSEAGPPELFQRVEWTADLRGDGAGFDILSYETTGARRYIEVKTTNGPVGASFVISRNELEYSREVGPEFHLYRVFNFLRETAMFQLQGDVSRHVHLEPIDYRASFRRLVS
jgi:hypothetical protein